MSDTVEKALRLAKSINAEGKSSGGGAWTRKEGKNPEGGLNEKGRASLRAQGHDIKRPQPEGGSRRDSFCARMKGMKAKLTSKETANDPDSRINKSLRKWNCADGGKVWDKPRPDDLGKPKHLSSAKKAKAKAMAKAAGRPYPNLVDNMRAAKASGGRAELGAGGDAVKAAIRMIRAYHGSPHKFDKFDISKMGTGEGAQAYGHGLYFADKEDVARSYRDALAAKEATIGGSFDNKGHMYEVNLHTDPEHLLDWDKPLSEQKAILDKIYENLGGNNKVKELNNEYENLIDMPLAKRPQQNSEEYKFLENRYNELQNHPAVKLHETLSNNPDVSGKNFYYRFGGQDPEQASIKLKNVGIPGIKYLDQGSRGAGEGSSNYVMFDPNNIEILRRYKNGGNVDRAMSMIKRMHREDGGFNPNDYTTLQNAGLDVRGPNEAADLAASYASMQGPQSDDAQIRNYEEGMREFQRMTPEQQQMSHAEAVPMRPVSINAPAFGGVKHIGDAPYNVAEPLSAMAQTAYGMKTMPLYQTPLAPVARAIDAYETAQELRKNPSLGTAASHAMSTLWPVGGKAGAALAGAAAGAGLMGQESAEASPADIARIAANAGKQTVRGPLRNMYPAIYGNPRELAAEAASRVAPESPALKRLFGVTRPEMYEMAGNRAGNAEPVLAFKANPRGNVAAQSIMVPENEKRLQDLLVEGQKQKGLREGMMPWYYMDPAYKRLEELVGPEEAKKQFHQLNTSMGTMSPNSTVNAEIARGTSAHYMANQGRFSDFDKYGGNPRQAPPDVAKMLEGMPGHKVHSTSQIGPLRKFMETGEHGMQSPKAPLYIQSSSVPELGFQTKLPVPDAHYTRLLGLPDVRGGTRDLGASMVMPEYQSTGDWFRNKIAEPVGMQAVPAQALMWGAGSGASGVKTAVGSPKLEMLADHIMSVAKRNNIAPELARDLVLQGKMRKRGGKVDAALRLADQRIASASGGKMSPEEWRQHEIQRLRKSTQTPSSGAGQTTPRQAPTDATPSISRDEYDKGNLGGGQYAMADGGKVKRHGYADGGQPGQAQGQFNPGSYISNVYNQFGGRAPNQSETNFWQGQMNQGSTPQQVYQGIANDAGTQAGYYSQYNAADPNSFNTMLNSTYQSYLGRAPNASDTAFWQGQLAQGSTPQQIVQGIANDQAARNYAAQQMAAWGASGNVAPQAAAPAQQAAPQSVSNTGVIGAAYNQYLGRAPTQDEVNFWQGELNKGVSPQQIMQGISSDASVRQSYANQYNPANQSTFNNLLNSTYQAYLGRAPNESDIAFWQGELNKGVSPQQIVSGIANDQASKNFLASQASQYGPVSSAAPSSAPSSAPQPQNAPVSTQQYITDQYQNMMGRDPSPDEMAYWSDQIANRGVSQNFMSDVVHNDVLIGQAYNKYFGRDPTQDEKSYWMSSFGKGTSPNSFVETLRTDVGAKNYANSQFIADQYQGLLGRQPSQDELNYWQNQINKGSSLGQVANAISSDPGSQDYQASNFGAYQVAGGMPSGQVTNSGLQNNYAGRLGAVVGNLGNRAADFVSSASDAVKNYFAPLAGVESRGNPTARSGSSSAAGLFQFIPDTWVDQFNKVFGSNTGLTRQQILNLRTEDSPAGQAINKALAASYAQEGEAKLQSAGLPATPENLYSVHFLGNTGLAKLNASNPNAIAGSAMSKSARHANPSYARMTVGNLFKEFSNRLNDAGRLNDARQTLNRYASASSPAAAASDTTPMGSAQPSGVGGAGYPVMSFDAYGNPISTSSASSGYTSAPAASYSPPHSSSSGHVATGSAPSISHTGGGGSHTVSHGSGSVSFAPPASSGGGSGTIDPYFGHAGSTHYDPRYGNGVGGGADWEWDYAKKRGGKISDKKDMKVYSRPAGGSHNRGAKAVKDALRLARK